MPASATLEASLVIPIFIFAIMSVMYLIQIVGLQLNISQALYNNSRKVSKYAYVCEHKENSEKGDDSSEYKQVIKEGLGISLATGMVLNELGDDFISKSHIVGGKVGFNFLASKILDNNQDIELTVKYAVKNPFVLFGKSTFTFNQSAVSCAWLGREPGQEYGAQGEKDMIVYITVNGEVYHKSKTCTYLQPSVKSLSYGEIDKARNSNGGKYYICEKCEKASGYKGDKSVTSKTIYITDYGDRYHTDINCSNINRNILAVPFSSVSERRACSKCG